MSFDFERLVRVEHVVDHLDAGGALEGGDRAGSDVVVPVVDVQHRLLGRGRRLGSRTRAGGHTDREADREADAPA